MYFYISYVCFNWYCKFIFMDKFYILEKRKLLDQVYKIISSEDINIVLDMIDDIEKETSTVIVYMKNIDDINTLNNYIFNSFLKRI